MARTKLSDLPQMKVLSSSEKRALKGGVIRVALNQAKGKIKNAVEPKFELQMVTSDMQNAESKPDGKKAPLRRRKGTLARAVRSQEFARHVQ